MASTPLTPAQRALRARIAAYALHAQGGTTTKAATDAFLLRFEREVDPEGVLAPEERAKRAEHARRAYMSALALRSSRVREQKKAATVRNSSVTALEVGDVPGITTTARAS
jgi:hypothetical protein